MPTLDDLLTTPALFALFGLERKFNVDMAILDQRYAELKKHAESLTSTDPAKAGQALAKLATGRRTLADPAARGGYLLDLIGGAGEPETDGLPPGFSEKTDALRSGGGVQAERDRLIGIATNLFRLTGSADNGVVQRERRRQIRETLNAIRRLDERADQSHGTPS